MCHLVLWSIPHCLVVLAHFTKPLHSVDEFIQQGSPHHETKFGRNEQIAHEDGYDLGPDKTL